MITCVVVANNRPEYLSQVLEALKAHHPELEPIVVNDDAQQGMAANVQRAWDTALETGCSHVLHMEDDMLLLQPLPLYGAEAVLGGFPSLAQVTFKREPWWGLEVDLGDQLAAICAQAERCVDTEQVTWHNFIFSLNPCLIPREVLELGWSSDNEAGMTAKLLGKGYGFAMWGHVGDPPFVRHIGHMRGAGWKL